MFTDLNSTATCIEESSILFYILLVIMPLGAIFYYNIQNYIDATAIKLIKVSQRGATYGAQRIFGAIGATASIFMTGFLVERFQFEGLSDFSMGFFIFVPFPLILIPISWLLVSQYENNINAQQNSRHYSTKWTTCQCPKQVSCSVVSTWPTFSCFHWQDPSLSYCEDPNLPSLWVFWRTVHATSSCPTPTRTG